MRPHLVHWLNSLLPGDVASLLAPTWFTCVGLAGLVTLFVMLAVGRRHHIDTGVVASIVLWCYLAAVAAGIAVPMMLDAAEQLVTTGRLHLHWAGMTSFWGYLAGAAAVVLACRHYRLPLARFADLTAAPLGLALVLARLGCFLAGCDYGKVAALPWAIRFPAGSPAWHDHVAAGLISADRSASLPVHPTQLYEAALGVIIALTALAASRLRSVRNDFAPTPSMPTQLVPEPPAPPAPRMPTPLVPTPSALTPSALTSPAVTRSAPLPSASQRSAMSADGSVFLLSAAMYAVGRIAIEALRGDAGRGLYLGISSGQIFSLVLLAAIAGAVVWRRRSLLFRLFETRRSKVIATATLMLLIGSIDHHAAYAQASFDPSARPVTNAAGTSTNGLNGASGSTIHIGALVGLATPFNRRSDQVATLGGPSLSIGLVMSRFGIWLDLDSLGNRDASHGTVLLSGGVLLPVANHLHIGGRVGLGATLVNFDDPAFRDVAGTAFRFEAIAEYQLSDAWAVWLRPLSFDILTAADLGGPIATWQTRIGLGYQFGTGRRTAPAASQPPAYPTPAQGYPPPGYAPQQPYPPQGYPPPPQQGYPPPPQQGYPPPPQQGNAREQPAPHSPASEGAPRSR